MYTDITRKYNQAFLKVYADRKIRLTVCNSVATSGLDREVVPKCSVNDEKLENNISRAKSIIYEYAFCNQWDFFATLTISPDKFDRFDLPEIIKKLGKWLSNHKRVAPEFRYLLVPEEHKNGAWHFHGFVSGLPESELHQFVLGDKMSSYIASKVKLGECLFKWIPYDEKFGFCDLEPVRDSDRVSSYITKYCDKQLFESKKRIGCHLYYCSKGLKRASVVANGLWLDTDMRFDFQNEYVSIKEFPYSPELLDALRESIAKVDYTKTRDRALVFKIDRTWRVLSGSLDKNLINMRC